MAAGGVLMSVIEFLERSIQTSQSGTRLTVLRMISFPFRRLRTSLFRARENDLVSIPVVIGRREMIVIDPHRMHGNLRHVPFTREHIIQVFCVSHCLASKLAHRDRPTQSSPDAQACSPPFLPRKDTRSSANRWHTSYSKSTAGDHRQA